MAYWRHLTLAAAALLALAIPAAGQIAVPPLSARVIDLASTLSADQKTALEEKLRAFEERKGSQLAVLIVPSTEPEDIAAFGIRVAEQWQLGRRGVDDGAILIVAKNQRRMRIEVGYGLEGALTDALSRRIIDEAVAPRFRQGDFYGGLDAGITQMIRVIEGEPLPEPDPQWSEREMSGGWILPALLAAFFLSVILRLFMRWLPTALVVSGGLGFFAYVATQALLIAGLAALGAFFVSLLVSRLHGTRGWSSGGRRGHGGGWGNWSDGGSGGGGFGGGGFSGGGGGFGGGGASGGW